LETGHRRIDLLKLAQLQHQGLQPNVFRLRPGEAWSDWELGPTLQLPELLLDAVRDTDDEPKVGRGDKIRTCDLFHPME
jgi:hypothetical protein